MTPARLLKTIDSFQRKQGREVRYIESLWCIFGQSIREQRKKRNIGLKEFSRRMQCSRAMIGFLESGKRQWNFDMAKRAVKLLKK